jgi:PQQ-like domain
MRGLPLRWLAAGTAVIVAATVTTVVVLHRGSADPGPCPTDGPRTTFDNSATVASGPPGTIVFDLALGTCTPRARLPRAATTTDLIAVSYRGVVAVYDRRSGRPLWHQDVAGAGFGPDDPSTRLWLVGDAVLAEWRHGENADLTGWDLRTGKERFPRIRSEQTFEVNGDIALASGAGQFGGYDLHNGRELWSKSVETADGAYRTAADSGSSAFSTSGSTTNLIERIDLRTGRTLTPLRTNFLFSELVAATSSVVVVSDAAGRLTGVSASDGRQLWTQRPRDISMLLLDKQFVGTWLPAGRSPGQFKTAMDISTGRAYVLPRLPATSGGGQAYALNGSLLETSIVSAEQPATVYDLTSRRPLGTYRAADTSYLLPDQHGGPGAAFGFVSCTFNSDVALDCRDAHLTLAAA